MIITAEPRKSSTRHGQRIFGPVSSQKPRYTADLVKQTSDAFISLELGKDLKGGYPKPQLPLRSCWTAERLDKAYKQWTSSLYYGWKNRIIPSQAQFGGEQYAEKGRLTFTGVSRSH